MTDLLIELEDLGVNVNEGLERFMGNETLYERMLKKFPDVLEKEHPMTYIEEGNIKDAITSVHTLKGVVGNLSINNLFHGYTKALIFLREDNIDSARETLEELSFVQDSIVKCIKSK